MTSISRGKVGVNTQKANGSRVTAPVDRARTCPKGKGWFVLNARDTPWIERKGRGFYCEFEGLAFAHLS
jgi:hypothetical protein